MVATPIPRYHYPAGSAEVPVYGSSVIVPALYQQPTLARPTVMYQDEHSLQQDQMKTIFPMGAPTTFAPFTAPQYQYTFVDSTVAFVPASGPAPTIAESAPTPASAPEPEASKPEEPSLLSKKKSKSCC